MVTNDISEIDLMDEETKLNEVKDSVKSDWGKIMAVWFETVIKRNPKILIEGFGVPSSSVAKIFEVKPENPTLRCPVCGSETKPQRESQMQ